MALPARARSTGPLLLGLALVLLLGLAEARSIASSSASSSASPPGHQHAAKIKRAKKAKLAQTGPRQQSTGVAANATSGSPSGRAILADPDAPIEWQALLRMQTGWSYQYTSWSPLNPCSDWDDITCSGGHVTDFDIEADLVGGLTTDFGTLSFLNYFYSDDYYIGGVLPTNVGNLRALTYFFFNNVQVTGTIPTSFGLCTLLTELDISENGGLVGTVPSALGRLSLVDTLYLYYNQLTAWGEIGNAGTMPNLVDLEMYYTLITNLPTSFYKLVSVTYIDQYNSLTATLPNSLSKMTQLEEITLYYNRLVGTMPSWIATLPELSSIDLRYNFLTGVVRSPASSSNAFEFNYFTSGDCYNDNCQPGCPSQRSTEACARFCGTNEPNGACGGRGTCVPGIPINRCLCNAGRRQVCLNNQCTCV